LVQLGFPQLGFDLGGSLIDTAATADATQRGGDPAHRQFGCGGRCRRNRQYGTRLRAGDPQRESTREDRQEGRVELAQRRPQLMVRGGAPPDRVLVCTGQHRDRLAQLTIGGESAVQVGIHPQDVGQRHRVSVIGLRPCHRVAFPIPGHRQWVDRIHRPAGCPQR
jgi:hypothetical protein